MAPILRAKPLLSMSFLLTHVLTHVSHVNMEYRIAFNCLCHLCLWLYARVQVQLHAMDGQRTKPQADLRLGSWAQAFRRALAYTSHGSTGLKLLRHRLNPSEWRQGQPIRHLNAFTSHCRSLFGAELQAVASFTIRWREELLLLKLCWEVSLSTTSSISIGRVVAVAFAVAQALHHLRRGVADVQRHGGVWLLFASLLGVLIGPVYGGTLWRQSQIDDLS